MSDPYLDMYAKVTRDIAREGQSIIGVCSGGADGGFCYTIGNHEFGLPELLIVSMDGRGGSGQLLNALGAIQRSGERAFRDGEMVIVGGKHPVRMTDVTAAAKAEFTFQVGHYYGGDDYRVMQAILPDPDGRFPDDPGCAARYRDQLRRTKALVS